MNIPLLFFFTMAQQPQWAKTSSLSRIHDHTQLHKQHSEGLLWERSARRRDLYLTIHNTHKRQTSMSPAGFEPAIPASERPQMHALDRVATGIGCAILIIVKQTVRYPDTDSGLTRAYYSSLPRDKHVELYRVAPKNIYTLYSSISLE